MNAASFRDQFGVCHVFSPDARAALRALGQQVKACVEGWSPSRTLEAPSVSAVKVLWNKLPEAGVTDAYAAAEAKKAALLATGFSRRKSPLLLQSVRGFFTYKDDVCHVVVPDRSDYLGTLGHEFKHCVDGLFHDRNGEWLRRDGAL